MTGLNIVSTSAGAGLLLMLLAGVANADLPDGPGKAATIRVCGKCHSPERAASLHQRRSAWEDTIVKMMKLGAEGSDEELDAVLGYLSTHFGPEAPKPLEINKARAVDLEAVLLLRRSQAEAVIAYRTQHGDFKSVDDLRKVPGLDFQKIETKASRLVF
jgi:competence protein ComEA